MSQGNSVVPPSASPSEAIPHAVTTLTRDRSSAGGAAVVVLVVLAAWVVMRVVFFQGFCGEDDFHHLRYALLWDRLPANHWETRLLYNALLRASLLTMGYSQASAAVPGLLGSLLLLGSGLGLAWRLWRSPRKMLLAGLLLACLPIDVIFCTTPGAKPLAAGLLAVGTLLLLAGRRPRSAVLAGLALAIGIWTHVSMVFPAVILVGVAWLLASRPRRQCALAMCIILAAFVALEMGTWSLWAGDPLYQIRVIQKTHIPGMDNPENWRKVWTADGHVSLPFFWVPLRDLLASNLFGVLGLVAMCGGLATWRKRSQEIRVLTLAALLTWAWISYGTQTPTRYVPFLETAVYWYPLGLLFVLAAVEVLTAIKPKVLRAAMASCVLGGSVAMISLVGTWGQDVRISGELLDQVKAQPSARFVTDGRTFSQMCVLNAFGRLPNVFLPPASPAPLYGEAHRLSWESSNATVLVLVNRLNDRPDNPTSKWVTAHAGQKVFVSRPRYRALAYLLPEGLRDRHAWMVRKPPAEVRRWSDGR